MPRLFSDFAKCHKEVLDELDRDADSTEPSVVAIGFSSRQRSYNYLYPSLLAAISSPKAVPFNVDLESQVGRIILSC